MSATRVGVDHDAPCRRCGETFWQCALFALLIEAGARASWNPARCHDGAAHDFRREERAQPGDDAPAGGAR